MRRQHCGWPGTGRDAHCPRNPAGRHAGTSHVWLDIVVWGLVAVILQLATFVLAVVVFRNLRAMIEADNVAAAAALVGVQIAIALLNAAAMAG